jgi:hypothetical protein
MLVEKTDEASQDADFFSGGNERSDLWNSEIQVVQGRDFG